MCKKFLLDVVNAESLNDLEAASAILFCVPSMWLVSKGDDLLMCCLSARARSKCPAIFDVDVLCLLAHETVDMLSQNIPICV